MTSTCPVQYVHTLLAHLSVSSTTRSGPMVFYRMLFLGKTKTMGKSLFFSLHFSCSCRNTNTGSVVDIPGMKPNWLSRIFTISLSRASMIRSPLRCVLPALCDASHRVFQTIGYPPDTKMRIACYTVRLRSTLVVAGPNSGECPCPFAIRTCIPREQSDSPCSQCNFRQPPEATLSCARENNQLGG